MIDDKVIKSVAQRFSIDPSLLKAQVVVESSGNADAFRFEPVFYRDYIKSNPTAKALRYGPLAACSFGLLQIMLETACEVGFIGQPWDLFDPTIGLTWGAVYLKKLLDAYGGDYERALCSYNGGPGAVLHKPYRTQVYADKVFREKEKLA